MGILRGIARRVKNKVSGSGDEQPGGVSDLQIEELAPGEGVEAVPGDKVGVHYTGWLTDGTEFDSSRRRGPPLFLPWGLARSFWVGTVGFRA